MSLGMLSNKVVCRPIILLCDTFDFYGHSVAGLTRDDNVDTFLVSKRQVGIYAKPMKARKNIELGSQICVIS